MTVHSSVKPGMSPKYVSSALDKDAGGHCVIHYVVHFNREQGGVWD